MLSKSVPDEIMSKALELSLKALEIEKNNF